MHLYAQNAVYAMAYAARIWLLEDTLQLQLEKRSVNGKGVSIAGKDD